MPTVDNYTALISGDSWNGVEVSGAPVIVTYSFPTTAPAYDAAIPGFATATISSFTAAEQTQAVAALGEWAAASGLVFIEVAPGKGDINFENADFNTTSNPSYQGYGGVGFYPFGNYDNNSLPNFTDDLDAAGDVFMNSRFLNADGTVNYGTLLHEIGHAIGLKHPTETVYDGVTGTTHDQVLDTGDDPTRTIMATVGDDATAADPHILQLDKDAAAYLYGPAGTGSVTTDTSGPLTGTNSVSSWVWDPTTETLTQTAVASGETIRGTSVNDVINGSAGDDRLFGLAGTNTLYGNAGDDKLYGGSGTNTLVGGTGDDSYYVLSAATTIVENPDEGYDRVYSDVSYTLPANVEYLQVYGQGLTATANNQGDSLFGDGTYGTTLIGGTGDDYIVGGGGDDVIEGGGGIDRMFGEGGTNRFVFTALTDAPVSVNGSALTSIGDFGAGTDTMDLSAIKASDGSDLTFIGTGAFTDHPGQVHDTVFNAGTSSAYTIVEGDVNGDGQADFQIELDGTPTLTASSFDFVSPTCYAAGTRLRMATGEVAVEDLAVGDIVLTATGGTQPVIWIGHRRIDVARHPRPDLVRPIRIRTGALGAGVPARDLVVSPEHALWIDEALVPARDLVNGATIRQEDWASVTYFHVELPVHDIVLAEGAPAESYLDCGNRSSFANAPGGVVRLHAHWEARAAARPFAGKLASATLRDRLATRALALGHGAALAAHAGAERTRQQMPRTNVVANPRAEGMATGRLGDGGVAPAQWWIEAPEGIAIELVGRGVEGGLDTLDLRLIGRATRPGTCRIYPHVEGTAASPGEDWSLSCYMRVAAGSLAGIDATALYFDENGSDGTYLAGGPIEQPRPDGAYLAAQRYTATRRLTHSATAGTTGYIQIAIAAGTPVDLTLRIAGAQMERGVYASALILPPSGRPGATHRGPADRRERTAA